MRVENHKYISYPTSLKLFSLLLGKGYGCIKKIHLNKMLSGTVKSYLVLTHCLPSFPRWSFCFVIPLQNTSEPMSYVVIALLLVCLPIILLFSLFAFLACFCFILFPRPHLLFISSLSSLSCYFLCKIYHRLCFLHTVPVARTELRDAGMGLDSPAVTGSQPLPVPPGWRELQGSGRGAKGPFLLAVSLPLILGIFLISS